MSLSAQQTGVLRGMIAGIIIALLLIASGIFANPFGYDSPLSLSERLSLAMTSSVFLAVFLAFSIGRLARHRFFSAQDIDGGDPSQGSQEAKRLQSLLQNTLEQTVLAFFTYAAWVILMPGDWLSVVPLAAAAFCVGRILFFAGYSRGASARAIGFTLAFYPSLGMLACIVGRMLWQTLSAG